MFSEHVSILMANCFDSTVRFLKAADMREKLHKYAADFSAHKNEVHDVIRIQTALTIVDIRTQIDVIGGSLFKILSTLGEDGRREKEAAKLVQMYGSVEAVLSVGLPR